LLESLLCTEKTFHIIQYDHDMTDLQ